MSNRLFEADQISNRISNIRSFNTEIRILKQLNDGTMEVLSFSLILELFIFT